MNLKKFIPKYKPLEILEFKYKFTVFVPAYNCEKTIDRVFKSLNNQTFKDFEVILINDGSTDATNEVINKLLPTANFKFQYINHKTNKHKMACMLEAIQLAEGEFFLTLDSDDECVKEALYEFNREYESIPENLKTSIIGVTCCCIDQKGNLIGSLFKKDPTYASSFEFRVFSNVKGEKWGFCKTSILKGIIVNDEIFGKGLIPESYLWMLIAKEGYLTKFINKVLRIYYVNNENNLSSLKYNKKAFGMAIYSLSFLNWFYKDFFFKAPKVFLERTYSLLKASKYLNYTLSNYLKAIDSILIKFIFAMVWPFRRILIK